MAIAAGGVHSISLAPTGARGSARMAAGRPLSQSNSSRNPFEVQLDRRKFGQLVAEHVLPLGLEFLVTRGRLDGSESRNGDLLVPALLFQDVKDDLGRAPRFGSTEDADHVVEISG